MHKAWVQQNEGEGEPSEILKTGRKDRRICQRKEEAVTSIGSEIEKNER